MCLQQGSPRKLAEYKVPISQSLGLVMRRLESFQFSKTSSCVPGRMGKVTPVCGVSVWGAFGVALWPPGCSHSVEVVKPGRSCLVPRLRQALPKNLGTRLGENYPGSWFHYGLTLFILVKGLHVQEGIFGWNHAMNIFFF